MSVNEVNCSFCCEFNEKNETSDFVNMIGSKYGIRERRIFETENIVCVPTVGSFVKGYLLLIPKKHHLSILSMSDAECSELKRDIDVISEFYKQIYKSDFVFFEHGTANAENTGGMSVVHAHMHLLPSNDRLISIFSDFDFLKFRDIFEVRDYYLSSGNDNPYLLFRDTDGCIYYTTSSDIPSQYFRKKICDYKGFDGMGDWKENPFAENIISTLNAAKQFDFISKL